MNDQQIVDLYFARNEAAIRETDRAHGQFCMGVSMNILASRPDAEECVNDTYLRTWNSIPPEKPRSLRAFLAKIVRNLSIDRYRALHAQRCNRDFEVALDELADCIPAPADPAMGETGDLADLLEAFLATEEETDRRLFLGRYWHAVAVKDLAAHYGLSANAVTKRLIKTRERLRVYLNERGYSL